MNAFGSNTRYPSMRIVLHAAGFRGRYITAVQLAAVPTGEILYRTVRRGAMPAMLDDVAQMHGIRDTDFCCRERLESCVIRCKQDPLRVTDVLFPLVPSLAAPLRSLDMRLQDPPLLD